MVRVTLAPTPGTSELPTFSIVVPTFNRPARLAECLRALAGLDYPRSRFEVIVVDDGGARPAGPVAAPFGRRLELTIIRQARSGPAAARNAGVTRAGGRYLAFTDDDCRPDRRWLAAFGARLVHRPEAVLGGRTLNALPDNSFSSASQLLCDYLYGYYNRDPDRARFFTSNNLALAAERFDEIGGFDAAFVLPAAEDRDFCDRLASAGVSLVYTPEAMVHHGHELSLGTFLRQHFTYGRGACRFREIRERRGRRVRLEPPSFYLDLVREPFADERGGRALSLAALLVVAQAANAAGFARETAGAAAGRAKLGAPQRP